MLHCGHGLCLLFGGKREVMENNYLNVQYYKWLAHTGTGFYIYIWNIVIIKI